MEGVGKRGFLCCVQWKVNGSASTWAYFCNKITYFDLKHFNYKHTVSSFEKRNTVVRKMHTNTGKTKLIFCLMVVDTTNGRMGPFSPPLLFFLAFAPFSLNYYAYRQTATSYHPVCVLGDTDTCTVVCQNSKHVFMSIWLMGIRTRSAPCRLLICLC